MAGAVVAIALALWLSHHLGYTAGYAAGVNAVNAADAGASQQARAVADQHQSAAADAGQAMQAHLDITLPAIEVRSDDTRTAIHTIYLAQPAAVAAECRRPDGVQAELDEAVDRANAAARGDVRPDAAGQDSAQGAGAAQRGGSG